MKKIIVFTLFHVSVVSGYAHSAPFKQIELTLGSEDFITRLSVPSNYLLGWPSEKYLVLGAHISDLSAICEIASCAYPMNLEADSLIVTLSAGPKIDPAGSIAYSIQSGLYIPIGYTDMFQIFDLSFNHVIIDGREQTFKEIVYIPLNKKNDPTFIQCSLTVPYIPKGPIGCEGHSRYSMHVAIQFTFDSKKIYDWECIENKAKSLVRQFILPPQTTKDNGEPK